MNSIILCAGLLKSFLFGNLHVNQVYVTVADAIYPCSCISNQVEEANARPLKVHSLRINAHSRRCLCLQSHVDAGLEEGRMRGQSLLTEHHTAVSCKPGT